METFDDKAFGGNSSTYPTTLPAKNSSEGESGLGLNVILYAKTKLEYPFVGIKMTFNSDSSAVSLGHAKSIVFDYKCAKAGGTFYVELEQTDITDSATMVTKLWYQYRPNRVRIPLIESAICTAMENCICTILH